MKILDTFTNEQFPVIHELSWCYQIRHPLFEWGLVNIPKNRIGNNKEFKLIFENLEEELKGE